ncbi:MAG: ATP-binding protein [Patescibacteria group bacterium]
MKGELQDLVARARLFFVGSPKRSDVFKLINGQKSAKVISKLSRRSLSVILQDLQKMKDLELIVPRKDKLGKVLKKENSTVYEKNPLLKHLPPSYFNQPDKVVKMAVPAIKKSGKDRKYSEISIPDENKILDICRDGEDQLFEFKQAGTDANKISREVCAFANTKQGGIIFYGVDDDGTISGSDRKRQDIDQSIQNSVKNSISPSLNVKIIEKDVVGHKIILILVPAWNRKDIYQFNEKVLIRKGTNVFGVTPGELRSLHKGVYVV